MERPSRAIDNVSPDATITKVRAATLDSVARPLGFGRSTVLLLFGPVASVQQDRKVSGDDETVVRTEHIVPDDGLLLDDEVMASLPENPTLRDLFRYARAAAARDRAVAEGGTGGPLTSFLEHDEMVDG